MHRAGVPSIDVCFVGTKRCHFKLETIFYHEDHAKMRAYRIRSGEKFLHNFRFGVGGDVEIFRSLPAHNVADATASEVRDMTALPQTRGYFARRLLHWRKRSVFHCIYCSGGL